MFLKNLLRPLVRVLGQVYFTTELLELYVGLDEQGLRHVSPHGGTLIMAPKLPVRARLVPKMRTP